MQYLIKVTNGYVRNAKHDTVELKKAKRFATYALALKYAQGMCGGSPYDIVPDPTS